MFREEQRVLQSAERILCIWWFLSGQKILTPQHFLSKGCFKMTTSSVLVDDLERKEHEDVWWLKRLVCGTNATDHQGNECLANGWFQTAQVADGSLMSTPDCGSALGSFSERSQMCYV
jgi:hypothetical protein